jgi:hypothetical protein
MGLLEKDERQALIGLLLNLPDKNNPVARRQLYAGIPAHLQNLIPDDPAPLIHFTNIVNTVDDESWGDELPFEGTWPVLDLIENAMFQAGYESPVSRKLLALLNKLEIRLCLPITFIARTGPGSGSLRHFTRMLDNLIILIPSLQVDLRDIYNSFNNRIYLRDCVNELARLKRTCSPVCDFSAHLNKSADLPSEIASSRIGLLTELKGFEELVKAAEDDISTFCANCAAKPDQPSEKRREIQQNINAVIKSSQEVLKKANELTRSIAGP